MLISERERVVKAPVIRCGRSASSVPGEGASCVVRTAKLRYKLRECRIVYAEFRWYRGIYYRPEADSLQGVSIFLTRKKNRREQNERTAKGL